MFPWLPAEPFPHTSQPHPLATPTTLHGEATGSGESLVRAARELTWLRLARGDLLGGTFGRLSTILRRMRGGTLHSGLL